MTWVAAPVGIALWALVIRRSWLRSPSSAQMIMTATVASLAAVVTLQVPVVRDGVIAAGGEMAAIIGDHLLALGVELLILLFVREIQGRGMSPRIIVGLTVAAATASTALLVIVTSTSEAMTYASSVERYPFGWPWLSYWSITIVYGLWAFGSGARFYWRYPRQAGARGEALGFLLIGVGTTIALALTVLRAGVAISAPVRQMRLWDGWAEEAALVLAAVLFAVIVAGLMSTTAASWLAQCSARRAHRRSVAALEPLWRSLTDAVPNITLDHRTLVSLMGVRLSQRDKLYRRMIEINDGLLALAPYTSAPLRQESFDQALSMGELPRHAHVVADTVTVAVALERYRARSPAAQPSTDLVTRQAGDFTAEVQRLSEIARASRWPLTAQITQQMLEKESA